MSTVNDGTKTISYAYDADGIRSSKTVNGVTTKYLYVDGKLMMENPDSYGNMMLFLYDDSGKPYGFRMSGSQTYYYEYNLQGDVIGIYNSSGSQDVWYTYDAWGKVISIDGYYELGVKNPIRYRGYYYDNETGFYYLNSRYYDPNTGRFLNADGYVATGQDIIGFNMYAYCANNPVIRQDATGTRHEISAGGGAITVVNKSDINPLSNIVNHIVKTHYTQNIATLDLGTLFGKIGFSSTVTVQDDEPGLLHTYVDTGNNATKNAVGVNVSEWLGADLGASSEGNIFGEVQITPWAHGSLSLGIDGIGGTFGLDIEGISYDFEVKGGWGVILIAALSPFVAATVGAGVIIGNGY